MPTLPFALRRPALLVRDLLADREHPDLDALRRVEDPERFVWAILPHAARTFSAAIAMLPARSARAAAVAYLYCRILDTYEDLSPDTEAALPALAAFAARFGDPAEPLAPAPPLDDERALDARDRAHLLLVRRCDRVDAMFATLPAEVRGIIAKLVSAMAEGMAWAARNFADQGGVLADEEQLLRYCRAVLGQPVLFMARLSRWRASGCSELGPEERETAMLAGEFIQLANVTRDVEKDLPRGVAFRPELAPLLGRQVPRPPDERVRRRPAGAARTPGGRQADQAPLDPPASGSLDSDRATDAAAMARVAAARTAMLDLALDRAPAFDRLIGQLDRSRLSFTRASALLMLLFTERYYGSCAARVGRLRAGCPASGARLLATTLLAVASRRFTARCRRAALTRLAALRAPTRG